MCTGRAGKYPRALMDLLKGVSVRESLCESCSLKNRMGVIKNTQKYAFKSCESEHAFMHKYTETCFMSPLRGQMHCGTGYLSVVDSGRLHGREKILDDPIKQWQIDGG